MATPKRTKAKPRKSRAKGRTAAEQFATAQRRIAEAESAGSTLLDLSDLARLQELPPELAGLTVLERLNLDYTQVSDLTPLAGLTNLYYLDLDGTPVGDLALLAGLTNMSFLSLMGTLVSDLAPLAGLAALEYLYLSDTQVSNLAPLAGLTALEGLYLSDTQVNDLAPLARLTALENLSLNDTQVSDLAPLAPLIRLADAVTSRNAMLRAPTDGLYYAAAPASRNAPLDVLVDLEQPWRTVETINEVRRQQGLPEHIPEGYERPAEIDALLRDDRQEAIGGLRPPTQPLPNASAATLFAVVGGRVDVVPPIAWRDRKDQAAIYHSRARKLSANLSERLARTDAVADVAASVVALTDMLGDTIEGVQPDQLRLASRSIAAKARTYGHPSAQWEISAESVSAIFELADLLVDLQSFVKTDVEDNEGAIRQLDLDPAKAAEAKIGLDEIAAAIETIPEVVTDRVESTFANAALLSATSTESDVKVAVEGERILLTENLALSVARSLGGSGDGKPPDEGESAPDKPERPRKRPRRIQATAKELTWDDFWERLVKRFHSKAPEAIADAATQAMASSVKHAPKTIAGLGAALVLWSASYPAVIGGSLALTVAWIRYELGKRQTPKK